MANKKISELSAAGTLDGTEEVPVNQGGATVKTTTSDIAALSGISGTVLIAPTGDVAGARDSTDSAHVFVDDAGTVELVSAVSLNLQDITGGGYGIKIGFDVSAGSIDIICPGPAFIQYTPAVSSDWNSTDPDNVWDALDRIAALLGTLGATSTKP